MSADDDETLPTRPRRTPPDRRDEAKDGALGFEDLVREIADARDDPYRSEGEVAAGGMGSIERVLDRSLQRRIALKRLHARLRSDPEPMHMFVREARITGQLQHPGVVPVHTLGVDSQHLYFTMELVAGRTLAQRIEQLPLGPPDRSTLFDLLDVVVRVCDALSFAHDRGILHCDIKPANVMIGAFGQVYLMDWGVARYLHEEEGRQADPSNVVGTPSRMAPEQARGEPLDERTDVFAVGALLYEIITRRPPFRGESTSAALSNAALCRFEHPDAVPEADGTPVALVRLVAQAMAPDRADRHASVRELRDSLVRFMRGVGTFPRLHVEAGEDIVREGERGSDAFVVESGRCEVHRRTDGQRTTIRIMGPGEVFGEMAILSPGPRTASVTALESTTLRRITAETLRTEVDSMQPWMGALVRTLATRFRERDGTR